MRFDPYSSGATRPTTSDETAGVRRAAAIYAAGQPAAASPQNPGPQTTGEARANVSPLGQLLRDLHGIKSNDPKAFSNVTATIADRLYEMAARESSDEASEHIQRLAERFSVVSQTGNLAALRPSDNGSRVLHGPAAYANQRQREEARELRVEVRTAIDDVLQPFVDAAPEIYFESRESVAPPQLPAARDDGAEREETSPRTLSVTG